MRTDKNFPAYTYTRYDEGSKDLPTNTCAKFKFTKKFQHIHTQHANLTAANRCNTHAKMKPANSFPQIYTLAKLNAAKSFLTHSKYVDHPN